MLKAVTFDFWGTLVDARFSASDLRVEALAEYLPDTAADVIETAYGETWQPFHREGLLQGLGLTTQTFLSILLDRLDTTLSPDDFAAVLKRFRDASVDAPPPILEGVPEVLAMLKGRGIRVGLISDTGVTPGVTLHKRLDMAGLTRYFDHLTFSDALGVTKTQKQPFRFTARALGVAPGEALHIGDLPETDIRGGNAAGFATALLLEVSNRIDGIPEADLVVEKMADFGAQLEPLL